MYHQRLKTKEQCFWEKVDKSGDCWVWTAGVNSKGRAVFRGKSAPRISYEMSYGQVPPDLYACHHCDNPKCVNPSHMFLGTQAENVQDMFRKGRANKPTGESHWNAKHTAEDIRLMRMAKDCGFRRKEIREMFAVSKTQLARILRGEHWKDKRAQA